jgi:hypothetical protein
MGRFSSLPIHAAGIYDEGPSKMMKQCCSDYIVSSYTPSISTLLQAQKVSRSIKTQEVKLLLVAEKGGANTGLTFLKEVEHEVEEVYRVATGADRGTLSLSPSSSSSVQTVGQCKLAKSPAVNAVAADLKSSNFVHLACHGVQDLEDALHSGFCLHDGRLTVSQLMDIRPDEQEEAFFFAFLSACETAKGDKEQPDQAVHLAAAMLFAGFRTVVGTMWYVTTFKPLFL